jgi:CHAT domain-containing protein
MTTAPATLTPRPRATAGHRAWSFAKRHALTVLPSVASLRALRQFAKSSKATQPYIGFGNPLLDGDQRHPQYGGYFKQQAALARVHQSCEGVGDKSVALHRLRRSVEPVSMRGGLADLSQLTAQAPLPETTRELCDVAAVLRADHKDVRLGARATERDIKSLSASGALADYQVVHFATHGTLAGQLSRTAESGLILTPPNEQTEEDDGYLSASEIAALKLDADWVILSACNTAAGQAQNAEALSGLARAFIYAQARALLVSHWAVDSDATVKLITSAMREIARDRSAGRAEVLRRSMLAMIDKGDPHESHPAFWSPFIVVGEGAR